MRTHRLFPLYLLSLSISANAGTYDQPTAKGAQWLAGQQNGDGSWGTGAEIQPIYTSVAVRALVTAYKRQNAYFAGVTWLESHGSNNVDLASRRAGALTGHGDSLTNTLIYLQNTQAHSGTRYFGWGLSSSYTSSAIDTALALIAAADMGGGGQIQPALNFLKSSQRTGTNDQGWSVGNTGSSDPTATALVVQALSKYTSTDASLLPVIANGLSTLNALIDSASPKILQALAAQAAQEAGNSTLASTFLSRLTASQSTDGSWDADPYVTALATRALATTANPSSLSADVSIPDQALRRAINLALGRNAMDDLNRGELAQLTTLSAVGMGIGDLTGLEWATNLTTADLRNNNLSNTTPLSGLTQLATLNWTGNPGNPGGGGATQVPAVPNIGLVLLAASLLLISHFRRKSLKG